MTTKEVLELIEQHRDAIVDLQSQLYAMGYRMVDEDDHVAGPIIKHDDKLLRSQEELEGWIIS